MRAWVSVQALGAGMFSMAFGRILFVSFSHFGLGYLTAGSLSVMILGGLVVWVFLKIGFAQWYAIGMAAGCALIALAGIYELHVRPQENLPLYIALQVGIGIWLMIRSYSEGPEPGGWKQAVEEGKLR